METINEASHFKSLLPPPGDCALNQPGWGHGHQLVPGNIDVQQHE